ncbi:MAG: DEAD/DEAH box helicase, partial [Chloroflexi bacterium]|nr:DEAD/DEAH box helicase [Chloroflexota bacterium]
KHMVAAGLAGRQHLRKNAPPVWRLRLKQVLDSVIAIPQKKTSVRPYWFFLSLQSEYSGWKLTPYRVWLDRVLEGILPPDNALTGETLQEIIHHNRWLLEHVKELRSTTDGMGCVNCASDTMNFVELLLQQNRQVRQYYYHNYQQFSPVGSDLAILSQMDIPLFYGTAQEPTQTWLRILPRPLEMRLRMERVDANVQLTAEFFSEDEIFSLENTRIQTIASGSSKWFMAGQLVFQTQSVSDELLATWMVNPKLLVPPEDEDEFLETFFPRLAEQIPLVGDQISWLDVEAEPVKRLYLTDDPSTLPSTAGQGSGELQAHLRFDYLDYEVPYESSQPAQTIRRKPEAWTLVRIHRQPAIEDEIYRTVSSASHGLKYGQGNRPANVFILRARVHPIDFLMRNVPRLAAAGFEIYGEEKLKSARVNRNKPTLSLNVSSGIDWFDLQAAVKFGDVETTLQEVRKALRKKDHYVKLADGTIGEIPDEWIERYKHLFGLGEQTDDGVRLSNHHLTLIDQLLADADRAQSDPEFARRKKRLLNFEGIRGMELPSGFTGELRPYQKAGYDWLHFLHEYEFGGCLADDMGLGKTIEALALLLSLRENGHANAANLLVLPRSLLINWQREAARFAPDLSVHIHHGADRSADISKFAEYDMVLTTYGTMLRDIEKLREYKFHYVVLDESQAIKNPLAKTSKAARLLRSDHRLVLTGTPVENSTFELWSQFAFLNPGLLGNLEYFKREFGNPIEKQGDEDTSQFLRKMVYPFILRRTKAQVAPELPPRTERIVYSDMEPAQRKFYNKTRDYYRAMLLGVIEEQGMNNARMQVLEGLLRLRQICNHPKLVKENFRGDSAKFQLLLETLETLQAEGHKALVFSQFVQMLKLVRAEMDAAKIPYVYLDGRTRKRQERVDTFQNDPNIPFFLISLRAGGVGLNLTAADYVIHIDPWWNPAVEMQATDRTHRIGQDKPVFVYKLIARDSVEEKILELQDRKKKLVEQLISTEGSFFKSLTSEDVRVLFS